MTIDPIARQKVARAELVKRVLIVIIAVFVVLVFWRQQATIDAVRDTQQEGSPILQAISEQQDDIEAAVHSAKNASEASTQLLTLVLDCLDPASECAKESAARDAAQLGALQAALVAVRYCADQVLPDPYTLQELADCVYTQQNGQEGDQP